MKQTNDKTKKEQIKKRRVSRLMSSKETANLSSANTTLVDESQFEPQTQKTIMENFNQMQTEIEPKIENKKKAKKAVRFNEKTILINEANLIDEANLKPEKSHSNIRKN